MPYKSPYWAQKFFLLSIQKSTKMLFSGFSQVLLFYLRFSPMHPHPTFQIYVQLFSLVPYTHTYFKQTNKQYFGFFFCLDIVSMHSLGPDELTSLQWNCLAIQRKNHSSLSRCPHHILYLYYSTHLIQTYIIDMGIYALFIFAY